MTHFHLFSCATNIRIGIEVAFYKDIHGFGQIFRQTGPVAPRLDWSDVMQHGSKLPTRRRSSIPSGVFPLFEPNASTQVFQTPEASP